MSKKIKLSKKTVKAFNKLTQVLIKRVTTAPACDYLDYLSSVAEGFYSKRTY